MVGEVAKVVNGYDWRGPTPKWSDDFRVWNKWKSDALTESQNEFVRRNKSWFSFRKKDIIDFFSGRVRIPTTLHVNNKPVRLTFSDAYREFGGGRSNIVIKQMKGHSGREVLVLDMTKWPHSAFDRLHRRECAVAELDAWYCETTALMEESLFTEAEPIPIDFKVYCVDGSPKSVAIINRNAEGKAFLDLLDLKSGLFFPWSEIFHWPPETLQWQPSPRLGDELVERAAIAVRFSESVLPLVEASDLFLSVDCYVVSGEPLLGELTPRPGAINAPDLRKRFISYLLS